MSISMKAIKPHVYAGKRIAAGQVYEVRGQSDARIMKALGRSAAHVAEVEPAKPDVVWTTPAKYQYRTASLSSEEAPTEVEAPRVKRAYRRRDMKAEE